MNPDPTYLIRLAQREDLPKLPAVEQAAGVLFRGTAEDWIADDGGHGLEAFELWHRTGKIWVALTPDGTIVGFAAVGTVDGQAYLHELDVHPAHGRRGLGRRLIEAVCAEAHAAGQTALRLATFRDIAWNAPYYARLGFRELTEAEIGPELAIERRAEAEAGLDLTRRVMMERRW
ncbi:MAG: GNAT family N-acetyltransferase [Anaerolineales bacterium]|nr:GNAT family N-acetyltransferase [Anaerolineales bacterium]